MSSPNDSERPSVVTLRLAPVGALLAVVLVAAPLFATGCPRQLDEGPKVIKLDAGQALRRGREASEADKKAAEARRTKRMMGFAKAVAVSESERICKVDADCKLIAANCCGCNRGGKKIAINRGNIPELARRRGIACQELNCRQMVSDDKTCRATAAKCEKSACVVDLSSLKPATAEGVGVEPIDGARDKPPPAPPGGK